VSKLVEVTVSVHPSNIARLKERAKELEIDLALVPPAIWSELLNVTEGDEARAREMLECRLVSGRRWIDVALSGPEGEAIILAILSGPNGNFYV
jgi:hypothetical protein